MRRLDGGLERRWNADPRRRGRWGRYPFAMVRGVLERTLGVVETGRPGVVAMSRTRGVDQHGECRDDEQHVKRRGTETTRCSPIARDPHRSNAT